MIVVKRTEPKKPQKYVFGRAAAAKRPVPSPMATVKLKRDQPPNVPFLDFEAIVGRGGMGVVWRAWHKELKRRVAVKVLDREFSKNGDDVRQFMSEVRTMTNIDHPGIIHGYGADFVDGRYYFVMDLVEGYTFGSLLQRKKRVEESDVLIVCESVAEAMSYAWNDFQTVHCDLKPENIMVDRDGSIKVADLGLCQTTNAIRTCAGMAAKDEIAGTPAYMSPEQIYGDVALDWRADVYCLGATMYHLLTGRILFPLMSTDDMLRAHVTPGQCAPDLRHIRPDLSQGVVRLVSHMLVKDRDQRTLTWEDVADAAHAISLGADVEALDPDIPTSMREDFPAPAAN